MSTNPPLSIEEFAARIREKYPSAYNNIDDKTLTKRILEKYPTYSKSVISPFTSLGDDPLSTISKEAHKFGLQIGSTKRSPSQNKNAGGASNSYHLYNQAVDITGDKSKFQQFHDHMLDSYGTNLAELIYGTSDHLDHVHIAFNKSEPKIVKKNEQFGTNITRNTRISGGDEDVDTSIYTNLPKPQQSTKSNKQNQYGFKYFPVEKLETTPVESAPKRFIKSAIRTTGIPTSMEEAKPLLDALVNGSINPMPGMGGGLGEYVAKGMVESQADEIKKAYDIRQKQGGVGKPSIEELRHLFAGLIPVFGPQAEHGLEQVEQGDYAGATGTFTGIIGQLAGPKIVKGIKNIKGKIPKSIESVTPEISNIINETKITENPNIKKVSIKNNPNDTITSFNINDKELVINKNSLVKKQKQGKLGEALDEGLRHEEGHALLSEDSIESRTKLKESIYKRSQNGELDINLAKKYAQEIDREGVKKFQENHPNLEENIVEDITKTGDKYVDVNNIKGNGNNLNINQEQKFGPGAQNTLEPQKSDIIQLSDSTSNLAKDSPLTERISILNKVSDKFSDVNSSISNKFQRVKDFSSAVWSAYKSPPPFTEFKKLLGDWNFGIQKGNLETREFAKSIIKNIPDKLKRESITNYIESEGNLDTLKERANNSIGTTKRGYEVAQTLTDNEKVFADNVRNYFDSMLQKGQEVGIIEAGVENYINHIYKQKHPITDKLRSDFHLGKLDKDFKFARKRLFETFYEAEQVGLIPQKDVGYLITAYQESFGKAIADRAFIRSLFEGKASDGRPLVATSGYAKPLEQGTLVQPSKHTTTKVEIPTEKDIESGYFSPEKVPFDTSDYIPYDHPALRKWKMVQRDSNGKPITLEGNLIVHPEIMKKSISNRYSHNLQNILGKSVLRDYKLFRGFIKGQTAIKQTILSLSGFHQVQEANHAIGHMINPVKNHKIDLSIPLQKDLVSHGLEIASYDALEQFSEGLNGGGLTNKIPILGKKILQPYNEYLFQDYIPGLKMKLAQGAFERNLKRYSSKLNRDQILELSANQANAAFGELNYKMMARNPSMQDTFRALMLAPDFLEARGRFVGQALKPYGREQAFALIRLAGGMYIGARVMNAILNNGDPQWSPDMAFSIKAGGKVYGLRTVPGDVMHLLNDPRGFLYHRVSPGARFGLEALTKRDYKGDEREFSDQVKDAFTSSIPIPIQPLFNDSDKKWWEGFLNSTGFTSFNYLSPEDKKNIQNRKSIKKARQEFIKQSIKSNKGTGNQEKVEKSRKELEDKIQEMNK